MLDRLPKFFTLQFGGKNKTFSVDRLKAHAGDAPMVPASLPRKGHLPAFSSSALSLSPAARGLAGASVEAEMRLHWQKANM